MPVSTKDRALSAAAQLLAERGAGAVSMDAIAAAVGIKPPSLYKHFQNREDLMTQLLHQLEEDYAQRHRALSAQLSQLERDLKVLGLISPERFDQEVLNFLTPTLTSVPARAYRQLLWARGSEAYLEKTLLLPLAILQNFFESLAGANIFRKGEGRVMALELISPLSHLTALADAAAMSGGDLTPIQDELRRHLKQFHRVYAVREKTVEKGGITTGMGGVGGGLGGGLGTLTGGGKRLFRGNR